MLATMKEEITMGKKTCFFLVQEYKEGKTQNLMRQKFLTKFADYHSEELGTIRSWNGKNNCESNMLTCNF